MMLRALWWPTSTSSEAVPEPVIVKVLPLPVCLDKRFEHEQQCDTDAKWVQEGGLETTRLGPVTTPQRVHAEAKL